jgi:hypothetical protein
MDIFIVVMLSLMSALNGSAWVFVKKRSEKWSPSSRNRFAVCLAILSFLGVPLVGWQAIRAAHGGEENRKTQLGDAERPPFVSIISLPGSTRFVTTNISDFPAYGTKIQLHDGTHRTTALRTYDYPEMAAHTAILDDKSWTPEDDVSEHRFTAEIVTRTGIVYEELILRRTGNDQWMRACRVQQGMRILEQDVDSAWPRGQDGQPDWN